MIKGLLGGLVAAIAGAGVWAGLAIYAGIEFGVLAWLIGGAVGFGVAAGGRPGVTSAGHAVILSIAAIAGGKYATVTWAVAGHARETGVLGAEAMERTVRTRLGTEAGMTAAIAGDIATGRHDRGETLNWPDGMGFDSAHRLEHFPEDVRAEAATRLASMTPSEREERIDAAVSSAVRNLTGRDSAAEVRSSVMREGFLRSWGGLDIVFVGLAVFTAARLNLRGNARTDQTARAS